MANRIPKDAYVIIIGSMKCGTSSLYSYLQAHPEICPAIKKEPEFFSEHQGHGVPVENYDDLWEFDETVHKYAMEASTGYSKYPSEPNVPQKMFEHGIKPKLIYLVRDPIDRIMSHYNFKMDDDNWKLDIDDDQVIDTTKYYTQLERYKKFFPKDDLLLLDFADLRDSPEYVIKRVYEFLEISTDFLPPEFGAKNTTDLKTNFEMFLRRLKLGALMARIPKPVRRWVKGLLWKAFPREKRELTDAEKESVRNELREDMANLHRVYGFDVGKWGFAIEPGSAD